METTQETAARLCAAAGLPEPGTSPGYVERRAVSRGLRVLDAEAPEALGAWQAGAVLLVEESWRRREKSPFGYRWPERSQRYLVIEEVRGGETIVHRHPVPAGAASVRAALAWALRLPAGDLRAILRCQGDVYVLDRAALSRRLRSDELPARHDLAGGELVHPVHAPIPAPLAGEEVVRVCRRAAVRSAYAEGGSRD